MEEIKLQQATPASKVSVTVSQGPDSVSYYLLLLVLVPCQLVHSCVVAGDIQLQGLATFNTRCTHKTIGHNGGGGGLAALETTTVVLISF